jgi:hypothetical protein
VHTTLAETESGMALKDSKTGVSESAYAVQKKKFILSQAKIEHYLEVAVDSVGKSQYLV